MLLSIADQKKIQRLLPVDITPILDNPSLLESIATQLAKHRWSLSDYENAYCLLHGMDYERYNRYCSVIDNKEKQEALLSIYNYLTSEHSISIASIPISYTLKMGGWNDHYSMSGRIVIHTANIDNTDTTCDTKKVLQYIQKTAEYQQASRCLKLLFLNALPDHGTLFNLYHDVYSSSDYPHRKTTPSGFFKGVDHTSISSLHKSLINLAKTRPSKSDCHELIAHVARKYYFYDSIFSKYVPSQEITSLIEQIVKQCETLYETTMADSAITCKYKLRYDYGVVETTILYHKPALITEYSVRKYIRKCPKFQSAALKITKNLKRLERLFDKYDVPPTFQSDTMKKFR